MRVGGLVIGIAGIVLFLWHLLRAAMASDPRSGYDSHQVMSVDSAILLGLGIIFYFLGRHRHRRRTNDADRKAVSSGDE